MTSTVGKLMTASIKNHFIEGNPGIKFNFLALFFCITTLVSFFQMLMAMILMMVMTAQPCFSVCFGGFPDLQITNHDLD